MNLRYQECAFSIPYERNNERNKLHKIVTSLLYETCNLSNRQFIFNIKLNEFVSISMQECKEYIVNVRAKKLDKSLHPWNKSISFERNMKMQLMVQLPCYKRVRGKEKYLEEYLWEDWFKQYIERQGFHKISIISSNRKNELIFNHKLRNGSQGQHTFLIPAATFIFNASVFDEDKASSAWLNGIGRSKGFGFGLLEIL